jgi:predicted DNA-binding transcriptional regulator AlpA
MARTYIRINDLATVSGREGLLPASPATIWRKVKEGSFPKPVKLGERITAWHMDDIEAWLADRHEEVKV